MVFLGRFLWFWYGSNAREETNSIMVIIFKLKKNSERNTLRKGLELINLLTSWVMVGNIWIVMMSTIGKRSSEIFSTLFLNYYQRYASAYYHSFRSYESTHTKSLTNSNKWLVKRLRKANGFGKCNFDRVKDRHWNFCQARIKVYLTDRWHNYGSNITDNHSWCKENN